MAKRKKKGNPKPLQAPPQKAATSDEPGIHKNVGFFPFGQYTSVVGVHTTLLAFTALFLPRTTFLLEFTAAWPDEALMTSRDKPQHPFIVPLTLSPISTLLCICLGMLVLQAWWGGWVRNWAIDDMLVGSDDEKRIEKVLLQQQRMTVCAYALERGRYFTRRRHVSGTTERVDNDIRSVFCSVYCPGSIRGTPYQVRLSDRLAVQCLPYL
jgi:hypothetical protein